MNYSENCKDILVGGGIGVMPTDTIYGVAGSAMNIDTVERVYSVRHRDRKKPMIVLIASPSDFRLFGIGLADYDSEIIEKLWPGKISIVLPCINPDFAYLHCGTESLAFRMPADEALRELLSLTGPIVAPSANPEGLPHATTIEEAKDYFGEEVDFYEDGGKLEDEASTVVKLEGGELTLLREGAVKLDDILKK